MQGPWYAAGDVTGRDQFVYIAAYGAKLAARNADLEKLHQIRYWPEQRKSRSSGSTPLANVLRSCGDREPRPAAPAVATSSINAAYSGYNAQLRKNARQRGVEVCRLFEGDVVRRMLEPLEALGRRVEQAKYRAACCASTWRS